MTGMDSYCDRTPSPAFMNLGNLAAPCDLANITPIQYAYDPVPDASRYLDPKLSKFPSVAKKSNLSISRNTTLLHPLEAGLPYRSSLDGVRESRHWRSNLIATVKVLNLLAADNNAADIEVDHGLTVGKLAKKELRPGLESRVVLATPYMFPSADERRIEMIAVLMILYFVFDDKVEETSDSTLRPSRDDFMCRLKGDDTSEPTGSELQRHIDSILRSIEEEDEIEGNGGRDMIAALRRAFKCVHPQGDFETVNSYLDFRNENVGAAFVIAAAKFSIRSSVDSSDPRFTRYLNLIGNHLGLINDLASYEKELRAVKMGETTDMINAVAVIKRLLSLPTERAAKVATYAYQLQLENWIMEELERLADHEDLTDEEWWFLEAVFLTATGNTFFCMVASRYGGEAARL
ncbi:hypothetical protein GJ744_011298 [Endocarpon pusillum]|uniref:Terpene synthase n=1 Tax=Endocarpon pusillum TaxID=364733 RepID=A0A8H7ARN4_9EURO|nr:hypothetical protein GJ744_011298 [Endocarpon pusillum]